MDTSEWVTVYTTPNEVEAEIIKNALVADGIRCELEGANQAAEPGLGAIPVKVQVQAKDAEMARKIVLRHEQHRAFDTNRNSVELS